MGRLPISIEPDQHASLLAVTTSNAETRREVGCWLNVVPAGMRRPMHKPLRSVDLWVCGCVIRSVHSI